MKHYPGSRWWKFDFHNHTPASSDYNAAEKTSLTPREWLLAYMLAEIDCVTVTDHNCGDWIDKLQDELAAMKAETPLSAEFRPLKVFPGVELTAADGLHILAVFGPSERSAKIHAIKALAICSEHSNNAESICSQGAVFICEQIRRTGGVAILAHAEEINGIFEGTIEPIGGKFSQLRGAREIDLILEKCDAIETHDTSHPAIIHFAKKTEALAFVDGSDAHKTNKAGSRYVWLKMAEPSIEGLRLALLDPESSLLRPTGNNAATPPAPPMHRIVSLSVSQLYLRRKAPLEAQFSPWFNSIIGGRGSGKSTLLETIRLALARDLELKELGTESDVYRNFERFKQVGGVRGNSGMLIPGTVISAQVEKVDADLFETYCYTWREQGLSVQRLDENSAWVDTGLNHEQARALFPIKIFSQKQVFELADRPSALLTYIDGAPEVDFDSWQRHHEELRSKLRELRVKERALRTAITRKPQLDTELKEVSRKTLAYQQSKVAEQVKVFRENQASKKAIDDLVAGADSVVVSLEGMLDKQNPFQTLEITPISILKPDPAAVIQSASNFAQQLTGGYEQVRIAVKAMRACVDQFKAQPEIQSFLADINSTLIAYREEVEKLKAEGVATAHEAEAALKRKQELESELVQIAKQEADLAQLLASLRKAYVALKFHRRLLTSRRQIFVNQVLSSVPDLRIRIEGQADIDVSSDVFRSVLRLQDGTFIEDVLGEEGVQGVRSGLLGKLVSHELYDPTHKRVTSLKLGLLERSKEVLGESLHGKFLNALGRLSLDDENALLEWFPEDKVLIEYRRDKSFQSLERASAGQKTSAILSFLLAHGDEPLLLDQPEDDLDNALVYSLVVQQIRANKSRRQIIIVTHNPNIVVNGDAELVLPMVFDQGEIHLNDPGGLQQRAVRERICEIMEGGKEAFRQRYKRILKDLEATP